MSLWWLGPPSESLKLEDPIYLTLEQRVPRLIRSTSHISFVSVACGGGHAMAVTRDARLFGWGWNAFGQVGIGKDLRPVPSPRVLGRFYGRTVASVSCGAAHTMAIVRESSDGSGEVVVYGWGAHAAGQLGHTPDETRDALANEGRKGSGLYAAAASTFSYTSPSIVETLNGVCGKLSGADSGGSASGTLVGVANAKGVTLKQPLSCGAAHTAIVSASGSLLTMGLNQHGQCGRLIPKSAADEAAEARGEKPKPSAGVTSGVMLPGRVLALAHEEIRGVACGAAHTLVLTDKGDLYAFGLNATGQLGLGSHSTRPCPTPTAVALGPRTVVVSMSAGDEFSACVTKAGEVFTWGFGAFGQLGHGNAGSMCKPRQVACEPALEVSCGGGQLYVRTGANGLLRSGYSGTWQQLSRQQEHATSLKVESDAKTLAALEGKTTIGAATATPSGGAAQAPSAVRRSVVPPDAAPPDFRTQPIELMGYNYKKVVVKGQQIAPTFARQVAAGRHFGLLLGEPLEPMNEDEAANLIQNTFVNSRVGQEQKQRQQEVHAAAVITERASVFEGVKRIEDARLAQERRDAATRVQAHQRRRQEQREVERTRREAAEAAAATQAATRMVISATGKLAPPSKHLLIDQKKHVRPKPPASQRVGGGFERRPGGGGARE